MSRNRQEMPPDDTADTELTIMVTIGEMKVRATINTGWRTSGINKEVWRKIKTPLIPYPDDKGQLTTLDGTALNPIGLTSFLVHFPSSAGWVHDAIVYEEGRAFMLGLDVVTAVGLSLNVRRGEYYVDPPSPNQRASYMDQLKRPLVCIGVKNSPTGNSSAGTSDRVEPTDRPHRNTKHDNSNDGYRSMKQEPGNSAHYRDNMGPMSTTVDGPVRGVDPRRCYTCGEWGHVAVECPEGPNRCHLCHRRGHQKKDCPGNMSPPKLDHRNTIRNRYKDMRHM